MAVENGVFLNKLNVDLVFETVARIESERLGVRVHYIGKTLRTVTESPVWEVTEKASQESYKERGYGT